MILVYLLDDRFELDACHLVYLALAQVMSDLGNGATISNFGRASVGTKTHTQTHTHTKALEMRN